MPGQRLYAIPLLYRTHSSREALRVFASVGAYIGSFAAKELDGILRLRGGPLSQIARASEDEHISVAELVRLLDRANGRLTEREVEHEDHEFSFVRSDPLEYELWPTAESCSIARVVAVVGKDGHRDMDDVFRVELTLGKGRPAVVIRASREDAYPGFQTSASARMMDAAHHTGVHFSPMTARVQENLDDLQELLEGVRLR